MNRQDKIKLLTTVAKGKKPTLEIWIMHTPFGIIDSDRNKKLQADEVDGYIEQLQKQHPLHNIVQHTTSLEQWNEFMRKFEEEY